MATTNKSGGKVTTGEASSKYAKMEAEARKQAADAKAQKGATKAYDAALTSAYRNGGLVRATPKVSKMKCGGKVR